MPSGRYLYENQGIVTFNHGTLEHLSRVSVDQYITWTSQREEAQHKPLP